MAEADASAGFAAGAVFAPGFDFDIEAFSAASASGSRCGAGGPASFPASAFKAAGTVPSGAMVGIPPPADSTVMHSFGRSPRLSGGFFDAGLAPGTAGCAEAISALRSIENQLASSVPQPSSPLGGFWFSHPAISGGHLSLMWKW